MSETNNGHALVLQDGARRHYVVPRAIEQAGLLKSVYTDWYSAPGSFGRTAARLISPIKPQLAKRMLSRYTVGLPDHKVRPAYSMVVWNQFFRERNIPSAEMHRRQSEQLTKKIVEGNGLDGVDVVVGFIRDITPSLCEAANERGIPVVADQIIAPAAVERREILSQYDSGESPEESVLASLDVYEKWEIETWPHIDRLTCMSEYVRDGLICEGIGRDHISVLPYPFDAEQVNFIDRSQKAGPLVVGFVGTVCTRKGAKHFFEVARMLQDKPIRFVMVGPLRASEKLLSSRPENVELVGQVPRPAVAEYLSQFDLFYFPSCCEGSAGSVVEAMASGLPVVTSRNSGTYARDNVEGIIVPPGSVDEAMAAIVTLLDNREKRLEMGAAARRRVEYFNIDAYSVELGRVLKMIRRRDRATDEH